MANNEKRPSPQPRPSPQAPRPPQTGIRDNGQTNVARIEKPPRPKE